MHKRIRPYRRTLSVCDSSNVYRLSLVGTFELTNHFRIRYNIFFDPRCLFASQPTLPMEISFCCHVFAQMAYAIITRLLQRYKEVGKLQRKRKKKFGKDILQSHGHSVIVTYFSFPFPFSMSTFFILFNTRNVLY